MAVVSYTELLRRVPKILYAENRELVTEMPMVIEQAEDELMLRLDHDLFRQRIVGFTVGADPFDPAGADDEIDLSGQNIMDVRGIRIQTRPDPHSWVPLHRRDAEMLTTLYARNSPGEPRFYTEDEALLNYRVFPYPLKSYPLLIAVNVRPVRLSATVDTSVLTDEFPRAMEKATLRQGALFMKNQTDADMYEAEMMQSVTEANMQISRRRRDETGVRPTETANAVGR